MPDTAEKTAGPATETETAPETSPDEAPPQPASKTPSETAPATRPDAAARTAAKAKPEAPVETSAATRPDTPAEAPAEAPADTPAPETAKGTTTEEEAAAKSRHAPAPRPDGGPATAEPSETAASAGSEVSGDSAPAARRPRRSLRAALRRVPFWWPVPLCLALGAGAGAVYSGTASPQYAAVSYVVVSPAGRGADPAASLGYAQAYGRIATDPMVVARAERRAGLRPGSIAGGVRASTSPEAPMVEITATSPGPSAAARNADAVAEALSDTARSSARRTGARLTVVSKAVAPPSPVSPSAGITVAVGACAGGLLGGLTLLVRRRPAADSAVQPQDG